MKYTIIHFYLNIGILVLLVLLIPISTIENLCYFFVISIIILSDPKLRSIY